MSRQFDKLAEKVLAGRAVEVEDALAMVSSTDDELLGNKTLQKGYQAWLNEKITVNRDNPIYNWWTSRYGSWSWRLGARFSF